jgi:hypothetical protein
MIRIVSSFFAATLLAFGLGAGVAQAQTRVFVAAQGSDANPCTFAAPCRSFQHAHDTVAGGGEIDVLDPAGYGAVTITKALSIQGHGFAGLAVPSGNGITINTAGVVVNLRGLLLDGVGTGGSGIVFNSGASLTVEDCVLRNLTGDAIAFNPNASSNLAVSNTFIADNGGTGVTATPTGSGITVKIALSRVEVHNSSSGFVIQGLLATGAINATAVEGVAAGNANSGFAVDSAAGKATTSLTVVRSTSVNNQIGLQALTSQDQNAILRVTQSTVTGNTSGWLNVGSGIVQSYSDNNIDGNTNLQTAPPGIPKK